MRVLLLERGRNVEHVKDYVNATKAPWEYPHRGGRTHAMEEDYPVLKRDYPLNEKNLAFWVNDKESPYTEVKRFDWYRGYQVGGRSLMWGRQSYRWSDFDFEANAKDGIAIDWPIRYAEIAPWYDHVERHAGISGSRDGLPQLPDGQFQPAMPLNCGEEIDRRQAAKSSSTASGTSFPAASRTLTQALEGRGAVPVPQRLLARLPVRRVLQHAVLDAARGGEDGPAHAEAVVDRHRGALRQRTASAPRACACSTPSSNQTTDYTAKVVFLCASTLNSTWLLMRSATDVWPGGLGSSSGELGHNLMDHHFRAGAEGTIEGLDDKYYYGRRPTGFYIPRYRNLFGDKRDYLRGFGYQGSASRDGWSRAVQELGVGGAFKDDAGAARRRGRSARRRSARCCRITRTRSRSIRRRRTSGACRCSRSTARPARTSACMRKDMINDMAEMLEQTGVKNVTTYDNDYFPGMGIHEMGTARMGRDPKTSVLNAHNQVWDAPNVFVTDGSCMVSAACQNPSLTYMALTARAADFAVNELKRRNL